jgi:hypothetical protein
VLAGALMEMADVEPRVAFAIEGEQALDLGHRRALWARPSAAGGQTPRRSLRVPASSASGECCGAAAEDVRGLQPGQLSTEGSQNDFLDLHGALHRAGRIGHGHLLGSQFFHARRQKRSFHVSIPSGQITYLQQSSACRLTAAACPHSIPPSRGGSAGRKSTPRRRRSTRSRRRSTSIASTPATIRAPNSASMLW